VTKIDADNFRKEAEQCRELARRAATETDRDAWRQLAEDWTELAQAAENRRDLLL
jgi:hypothetical protein